ncbi:MAG: ATP-binding cassette domain-containing protein [Phyllobacteriaceae bacterium]|nr:ATP-binding cassette domain-containing protein [Phyllobacteriaceae bacterium]
MREPALDLKGVSLRSADLPPLAPTDLGAEPGEHVALVERGDGAALTVMLIAAGFSRPDIGRVIFSGRDLTDRPPGDRPSRWLATGLGLFAAATVLDNIAFALPDPALRPVERRRHALARLDRHGLAALAALHPADLAPAEAVRVALVRAFAGEPLVLLLDRPFLGVPVAERPALREALATMRREHAPTVVERCDDPGEALADADRVALFEAGRLIQIDTPDRVWSSPVSAAAARLTGEVDLVAGRLLHRDGDRGRVATPIGEIVGTIFGPLAIGAPVTAGFRPEHVDLGPVDPAAPDIANRFEADFLDRRLTGATVRLRFAAAGEEIVVVRSDRGSRRHLFAGRTRLSIAAEDVWIHPRTEGTP